MKLKSLVFCCLILPFLSFSQTPSELVNLFFSGMANIDTLAIKNMSLPGARLCSTSVGKEGINTIECSQMEEFIHSIKSYKIRELDEQVRDLKEEIRGHAATVSMDYDFFFKGRFSHCGINVFHFLKSGTGWKLTGIDDTRNKTNCLGDQKAAAGLLLDSWHAAATKADSTTYFDALAEDAVFIGTDSFEVWNKQQFLDFAAPYFKKGKAWDFVKISRNLHFDGERRMIWFDEVLDTWMGPCRGSGWIAIEGNQLKIKQYVLSMTVPNDKIEGVLQAIGAQRRKRG
jgi:DNA-binding transcriptional regulator/RsmH inhibitor MraZ